MGQEEPRCPGLGASGGIHSVAGGQSSHAGHLHGTLGGGHSVVPRNKPLSPPKYKYPAYICSACGEVCFRYIQKWAPDSYPYDYWCCQCLSVVTPQSDLRDCVSCLRRKP